MTSHTQTPAVLLRIVKLSWPLLGLFILVELFPAAMAILAEQSVERGMIAQAQSSAAEHYLSALLDKTR
jgi:uncharacterized membrane protein (DUF373 family)